jgi:hypothetical protein
MRIAQMLLCLAKAFAYSVALSRGLNMARWGIAICFGDERAQHYISDSWAWHHKHL